jgi:hypothetical protein
MFKLLITISFVFLTCYTFAEGKVVEAPFGLKWGITKEALGDAGIIFSECSDEGWVEQCRTESVPKNISMGDFYLLLFTKKYGLQKAVMLGKDISGDPNGSSGKDKYAKLKQALKNKYEKSVSYEWVGRELWGESDEFYQCLDYEGCGSWTTYWTENHEGSIALELKGVNRGEGYIRLSYEGKLWSSAIDEKDEIQEASDFDAL